MKSFYILIVLLFILALLIVNSHKTAGDPSELIARARDPKDEPYLVGLAKKIVARIYMVLAKCS